MKSNHPIFIMKTSRVHFPSIAITATMVLVMAASTAMSAVINVGEHLLVPNQAGQIVTIMVSGGEPVSGLNFFAQIGDGGPELVDLGLPAGSDGPAITNVNLKTGTIFNSIPDDQFGEIIVPQVASYSIAISQSGGTVAAAGLLAKITVDTTGFFTGSWSLLLSNVLPEFPGGPFDTDFAPHPISITNGSLSIAIAGDCNRDGMVNSTDAAALAANWLSDEGVDWAHGDINGDGRVDGFDATIMAANWSGPKTTSSQSVPEPSCVVLLGIAILLFGFYFFATYKRNAFQRISACFCILVFFATVPSLAEEKKSDSNLPVLKIPRLRTEVQIDGNLSEACYARHKPLEDFRIAADAQHRAPLTRAWVFWREDKIVLAFQCEDDKIVAAPKSSDEMDVDRQDRVEMFIWTGHPQDAYLCLELAPRGAVLDYSARFYRRFDTSWNAAGLKVASVITPKGYCTEAELPAAAAEPFGIKFDNGSVFRGGLFRGNGSSGDAGEQIMWITWVESGKKKPDFHIAESFGRFILADFPR